MRPAHPGGFRVDANGCWIWQGPVHSQGYGKTRRKLVHRMMWEDYRGSIPPGKSVLHRCDVKLCGNPEHLFLGTQRDNLRDMSAKGRWGNATSKLSKSLAEELRSLYAEGALQADLARRFGISQAQVSRIVNRVCWR